MDQNSQVQDSWLHYNGLYIPAWHMLSWAVSLSETETSQVIFSLGQISLPAPDLPPPEGQQPVQLRQPLSSGSQDRELPAQAGTHTLQVTIKKSRLELPYSSSKER